MNTRPDLITAQGHQRGPCPLVSRSQEPFHIMARLLEGCGKPAEQVNHFEGADVKREKYRELVPAAGG
jgi:hypothetical protein